MRITILLLIAVIFSFKCVAQVIEAEDACREKCNHAHLFSRPDQADFYQYPSMEKYDVKYLKLDLAVEAANAFISGTALTVVKAVQPLDSFVTEFKSTMTLDSVFINGVKMSFQRGSDHIYIPLSPALPIGTTVTALFYYRGTVSSGAIFTGTIASNGLSYTATLSESYQAREWFPAKQILRDKIDSADIWITTSATNKAGSNGLLVAVETLPSSKKIYKWKTRYPMVYYLPSFSVGNYFEYLNYAKPAAMAPDSILIQNYVANNTTYFNSIKTNLDKTPAFIEKYSELFGLYPFKNEKYGHAQANIGGGMEHQTMTTLSSFGSTLIAHELGHQWWGDNVTCATWNHIWLNEGFASYCEYLGIEKLPALFSPTTATSFMQSVHSNVMSVSNGSVYVPNASLFDENRIFSSRLSYNKGSAIIHNLRFEIQDDNIFFQTLKNYQQQYKDSTATADDFKLVAETTSGKNFTDFFNQWYYGEGYPTFNIAYSKQGSDTLILAVNETVSASTITPFFKGLFEFRVTSTQGDTVVKVNVTFNNQQFKFYYPKTPNGIVIDPNNWVLNANGTITNGLPGFDFNSPAATSITCSGPTSASITLGTTSTLSYNNPVTLTASGLPSGTTISFGTNPVVPGNSTVVTLNNTHTLSYGTYNITITGISGSITKTRVITYIIQAGTAPTITTQPMNQTTCAGQSAIFSVAATGTITSYQWQLSTDGGTIFNNISLATGASYTVSNSLISQNNYRYRVIVSTQCGSVTSNATILTVTNCTITVNMKLFLQGYYIGSNTMQAVLNNHSVPSSLATEADTIIVELHHPTTYALIDTKKAVLLTNGTVSATFTQPAGSYYIGIRHRNTLKTWSAAAIACSASTPLYRFSTSADKAYADNQVQVEPGVWAFMTGDLNQDEYIDGNDFPQFDGESASAGLYDGTYTTTDMNGDGFTDGNDFPVLDVNSSNGGVSIHP